MRNEITEEQITNLMQAIPRAEEVDRLRAEIERLREALRDIASGDYSDPFCELTPEGRAREALEGKP